MRAVVQRVKRAEVRVDGQTVGKIGQGLIVYLGVSHQDTQKDIDYIVDKVINLRIFEDDDNKLNLSTLDINGEILLISQFTLYGDCRRGRRPSFTQAASPEKAMQLYEQTIQRFKDKEIKIQTGKFQAMMDIYSENYGPVTILLDSNKQF
ncbi:MAG TPA: D-tyrosyl-tRNA(Tyr) deacylase [Clostridiales bacterium]|nr:D-tyrosyl-tRNA(Tyr) deacylase [Clostridiales bacterium]